MFIKQCETYNKSTKSKYITHKLVESYRDAQGKSKHRVMLNLGKLEIPKRRWPELASILENRISGQLSFLEDEPDIASLADDIMKHNRFLKHKKIEKQKIDNGADMQTVDLNSVSTSLNRTLGAELVANKFWERLEFNRIFKECGFNNKQSSLAKAVIIGRLIVPGSELATWQWFQNNTALIEMTDYDLSGVGKDSFYETGDLLLENKAKIEESLLTIENSLFARESKVLLYDLTNTYFEGNCKNNAKGKRGHSKEKRTDCPLVTLALLVDSMGFPIFSKIYDGNKGEPSTLDDVLNELEKDTKKIIFSTKPILIMDRGIATKDNITLIKSKEFPYTVINRREAEKDFCADFESIKSFMDLTDDSKTTSVTEDRHLPDGWEKIDNKCDIYVKKTLDNDKCNVLSVSSGRTYKEQSMDTLKEERFLLEMEKLKKSFEKGNVLLPIKVAERIGRIKAKYSTASKFYEINLKLNEDNKKVVEILWTKKPQRKERSNLTGCYVIETTQKDLDAKEIWKQYMQLNRVESAFQDLKSELGLRPIYHQNTGRTESHLLIGVLAYHLLNSIEYSLHAAGDSREWKTIKKVLSSHERSTTILNGIDKKVYHVRASSIPEPCHNEIYRSLKIKDVLTRKKSCALQRL